MGRKPGLQWVEGWRAGEGGEGEPVPNHLNTALQVTPSYSPLSPRPPSLDYGRWTPSGHTNRPSLPPIRYQIPVALGRQRRGYLNWKAFPHRRPSARALEGGMVVVGERRDQSEPTPRWDCQDLRCSWRGPPSPLGEPVTPSPQNLVPPGLGGLGTSGSSHHSLECEWGAGVGGRENAGC